MLSLYHRQVAHALLTRPPLSHRIFRPEGLPSLCFVRLECVMHAASVHPEPGSNSLENCISSPVSRTQYQITSSDLFALLLLRASFFQKNLRSRISTVISYLDTLRLVVQFSMSGAADPLGGTAFLYYHITLTLVNTFFELFHVFFFPFLFKTVIEIAIPILYN